MAENQDIVNNRSRYMERLKERYPEREYADDEELFGQINEDYDNYDGELSRYQEQEKALSDLLKIDSKNPMGLYRSGLMYVAQHDTKNAEEYFKKALQNPVKITVK